MSLLKLAVVRPVRESEMAAVYDPWLRSHAHALRVGRDARQGYWRHYAPLIGRVVTRPAVELLAAVPRDNPGHLMGWVCGESVAGVMVLHYAYIKNPYRGHGFARRLAEEIGWAPSAPVVYTFQNRNSRSLAAKHLGPIDYLPIEDFLAAEQTETA